MSGKFGLDECFLNCGFCPVIGLCSPFSGGNLKFTKKKKKKESIGVGVRENLSLSDSSCDILVT